MYIVNIQSRLFWINYLQEEKSLDVAYFEIIF